MSNPKSETPTIYKINPLAKKRWSPRAFSDKAVEIEKLYALFEAARWAPSAFNEQPWRFIVGIKDKGNTYAKIFDALVEFNKKWANNAPVLLASCTAKNFKHNNKPNTTAAYDLGQAVSALTHQAMAENLFVHQMGGFDKEKIRKSFALSEAYDIHTIIALGYLGTPDMLPKDLKEAEQTPRERNPFEDFLWHFEK